MIYNDIIQKIIFYIVYVLYNILMISILIVSIFYILIYKIFHNKHKQSRIVFLSKFNNLFKRKKFNNNYKTIHIHASSLGEVQASFKIIEDIINSNNKVNIIITTTTMSSYRLCHIKYSSNENIINVRAPLDDKFSCWLFFIKYKPSLSIWIETELWLNFINIMYKNNVPLIMLNARISSKSYQRCTKYKLLGYPRHNLQKFKRIFVSNQRSYNNIINIIPKDKVYLHNKDLKFSDYSHQSYQNFDHIFNKFKHRWMAVSTHEDEEIHIAKIHHDLKKEHDNIITVIAPRYPRRSRHIQAQLKKNNFNAILLKDIYNTNLTKDTILIIDCFSIIHDLLQYINITFVGKTLSNKYSGGHSLIEPVLHSSYVLYGYKHTDVPIELIDQSFCTCVNSWSDLYKNINDILHHPSKMTEIQKNILEFRKNNVNTKDISRDYIIDIIKDL